MTSVSSDRRQGVNAGAAIKVPCKLATTANITLSGEQTIDGVAAVTDDRILVKDQTDASENGIYICDTSAWERAPDWDGTFDVKEGTLVYVTDGTTTPNIGFWYVTTSNPITIGTTSVAIARASTVLAVVSSFVQTLLDDTTGSAFLTTIRDDLAAETALATDDELFVRDTSATAVDRMTVANFLKVVAALASETAPAIDDELLLYDLSTTTADKITLQNLFLVINALTADAAPDAAADYVVTYDASTATAKKVLLNLLGLVAATQAEMETATSTNVAVTPGRQHLHPAHPKLNVILSVLTTTPTVTTLYNGLGTLSASRVSSGLYKLYWQTALTNPMVNLTCQSESTSVARVPSVLNGQMASTSMLFMVMNEGSGFADPTAVYITLYGDTT
jgi:uncharacterized cupin superfamily protein